jgi:hypothetical protein
MPFAAGAIQIRDRFMISADRLTAGYRLQRWPAEKTRPGEPRRVKVILLAIGTE